MSAIAKRPYRLLGDKHFDTGADWPPELHHNVRACGEEAAKVFAAMGWTYVGEDTPPDAQRLTEKFILLMFSTVRTLQKDPTQDSTGSSSGRLLVRASRILDYDEDGLAYSFALSVDAYLGAA